MLVRAEKQGIGRKSVDDVMAVANDDMKALSRFLGEKKFLQGDKISMVQYKLLYLNLL